MNKMSMVTVATIAVGLCGVPGLAHAQRLDEERAAWQEAEVRLPDTVNLDRVVTFELTRPAAMVYGIDPGTLQIDGDGVVRYAFVARSASGALNVLYEGLRCQTAEVKLYAHWHKDTGWTPVPNAEWQELSFRGTTRRAMQMAKAGICANRSPNGPPRKMLDTLRNGSADQLR